MTHSTDDSWEKFLNPQTLRANLIAASLFITAYEMLKESIVEELRSFHSVASGGDDSLFCEGYEREVLSLDPKKNRFRASVARLKADGVIDSLDVDMIEKLRQHRNDLAHELPKFLTDASHDVEVNRLKDLVELVAKIDRWWIINFELAIRDDIKPEEVDPNRIASGRMILLEMLLQTAAATDATELYRKFLELRAKQGKRPAT